MHPLQPGSIVQLTSLGQLPVRPLHRLRRPTARPPTTTSTLAIFKRTYHLAESPPGLAPPLPGPRHRPSLASTFRHPPNCYRYQQSVLLPIFSGPSFFPCRDRLRLHLDPSPLISRYLARNQDQEHKGHIVLYRRRHQLRPPLARPSPLRGLRDGSLPATTSALATRSRATPRCSSDVDHFPGAPAVPAPAVTWPSRVPAQPGQCCTPVGGSPPPLS